MSDQAMLFGSTHDRAPADPNILTVCALNVQSPTPARAQTVADWLLACEASVLVLTELRDSEGSRLLLECLRAEGFSTAPAEFDRTSSTDRYHAVVAAHDHEATPIPTSPLGPRVAAADVATAHGTVRMVGVYAPSNGMTADSSRTRNTFQQQAITELASLRRSRMVVAGDLNVVEPTHRPRLTNYEPHDYHFYTALSDTVGLLDAYRTHNPHGQEHSWFSDRFLDQRIDHTFLTPGTGTVTASRYDRSTVTQKTSDHAAMLTSIDLRTPQGIDTGADASK